MTASNVPGGNCSSTFRLSPWMTSHFGLSLIGICSLLLRARYRVDFPENLLAKVPEEKIQALIKVLACDPRPSYQNDEKRIYGFQIGEFEIKFRVAEKNLTVISIEMIK